MEENLDDPGPAAAAADREAAAPAEQQQQEQQQTEEPQQLQQQVEQEKQEASQQMQAEHQQQQSQQQQLQQQQPQQLQQPQQQQVTEEDILSSDESRLFIDELERRISLCEAAVGLRVGDPDPTSTSSPYETSVVLALCRLQHQATAAMRGSLAEIEAKYSELKVWLEGGPLSAARLLLTLQAKRDCVLQQEEQLLAVASQLRSLHLLQDYVNPPGLSELAEYKRRMHALEARGSALALQVAKLEEQVTHLAALYSTTMNMVSSVIEEWHCTLSKAEAASDDSSPSSRTQRFPCEGGPSQKGF
ncbi:hypothetical protein Esti_001200 [Eimeria stiedai]